MRVNSQCRAGPTLSCNQIARTPILTIPDATEGSAAFKQRLAILINVPTTHIYIDTSFLMWMTKIGTSSRQELIGWFQQRYCHVIERSCCELA